MAGMETPLQAAQKVIAAIPEGGLVPTAPDRYTTKNGVVLKLKRVPPLLVADAAKRLKAPEVPKFPNLDKDPTGKLLEENDQHPEYLRARAEHEREMTELSSAIYLTRGTDLESLPEGMEHWEGSSWSADLQEVAGLEVPALGRKRYYCWLRWIVLEDLTDFGEILKAITRLSGVVMEVDAAQAEASFRSVAEGDTSAGVRDAEGDGLGDRSPEPQAVGSN